MNNTNENRTSDIYLAHVDFETGRTQSFQEHTDNVTSYAKSICPMEEIQKLVEAAALFHDAGKLSDDVQKDFQDILKKGDQAHRNDLDHSTAGGRMLWKMMRQKTAAELLSTVVSHIMESATVLILKAGVPYRNAERKKSVRKTL